MNYNLQTVNTLHVYIVDMYFQQKQHVVMRLILQKDDSWERDLSLRKLKRRLRLGSRTMSVIIWHILHFELFISFQVVITSIHLITDYVLRLVPYCRHMKFYQIIKWYQREKHMQDFCWLTVFFCTSLNMLKLMPIILTIDLWTISLSLYLTMLHFFLTASVI